MAHVVTLADAKAHLEDLVAEASRNLEVLITDGAGAPMATLGPAKSLDPPADLLPSHTVLLGLLKGQIILKQGWDEPLEDFKPYLE